MDITTFDFGILTFNWYGTNHVSVYLDMDYLDTLRFRTSPTLSQVESACEAYTLEYSGTASVR